MCGCCGDSKPEEPPKPKPVLKRNNVCCTDIIVLILFVAFWGLMVYIAVYSIYRGNVDRLIKGYDSFGNVCDEGFNPSIHNITNSGQNTSGKPFVFFHSTWDPFKSMQVCVSKCPDKDMVTSRDVQKFAEDTGSRLCSYDIPVSEYQNQEFSKNGPCPDLPIFQTFDVLQRCAPDPTFLAETFMDTNRKNATTSFFRIFELDDLFRKVLSDLYTCWKEMIILCVVAVVISFLMVIMIRFLASIIVWVIVVLAALGSIAGSAFLWWTYVDIKLNLDRHETLHIPILDVDIKNELAFMIFAIIATVLTVILLLILLIMRKRILLVVALFHEAGKCLTSIPLLLIQPLWTFVVLFAFFVYWVFVLGFIGTAGYPSANYEKDFVSVDYILEGVSSHFWWIHLIGLIWTSEFILACQQFVIAGTVVFWYFTRNKKTLSCPIGKSICRLILHHIGSIAFGSLVITLVKIPRYILMYIHSKCEGSDNSCAKCCLKCCICCLWCLERILKFINQNAYTIIAIEGTNFCKSAWKAFEIITSNVLRVAAINSVGAFVLFLGKVGVMAATCAISVVWLKNKEGLHYWALPVLLLCIFSYLIAHCFLSVYEMVIDALLLCFCEDCQMNDGVTPGKEYYMNSSLMEFVENSAAAMKALEARKRESRMPGDEKEAIALTLRKTRH